MLSQGEGTPCIDLVSELVCAKPLHDAQRGRMIHGSRTQDRQNILLCGLACTVL